MAVRFFEDERKSSTPGIASPTRSTAWPLVPDPTLLGRRRAPGGGGRDGLGFVAEPFSDRLRGDSGLLVPSTRRIVRSPRAHDALNGYQKGRCFYCFRPIGIVSGGTDLGDVDHFFPHVLQRVGEVSGLDQLWNLVLACSTCNRGAGGKFDSIPALLYLDRLFKRNEYLITSHDPLRETLMLQTGGTTAERRML